MRKKICLLMTNLLGVVSLLAQSSPNANAGYSNAQPVPSASSLTTYMNSPVSIATGTPDISFPLISLPAKKTNISFSISHHPVNNTQREKASDVGRGWSLLGVNVITREAVNEPDEQLLISGYPDYDDIFYYSIPGNSGKFKIYRDPSNNTFQVINLSESKLKIEYIQANVPGRLVFDSFVITDNQGYKYSFSKYGISTYQGLFQLAPYRHRSIFYLTKIENENNLEIANFQYNYEDLKRDMLGMIEHQLFKLSEVRVPGVGNINLNYVHEPNNMYADPYRLNYISLNTIGGKQISKFEFDNSIYNRYLKAISKYGKTNVTPEVTRFFYDGDYGAEDYKIHPDALSYGTEGVCHDIDTYTRGYTKPWELSQGSINKIIMPTGGVVKYEFEPHKTFSDKTSPWYEHMYKDKMDPDQQYIVDYLQGEILDFNFNWRETQELTLQIDGNDPMQERVFYIKAYYFSKSKPPSNGTPDTDPNPPGTPGRTWYEFTKGGQLINNFIPVCDKKIYDSNGINVVKFKLKPGTYKFKINATYGANGYFQVFEEKSIPIIKNEIYPEQLGVRIKKISYLEEDIRNAVPTSETFYSYQDFTKPNNSSGDYDQVSSFSNGVEVSPYRTTMLYKNVTVKNDINQGRTEYTYKTIQDFPLSGNDFPYLNIAISGILKKAEVYNASNQKLSSTTYNQDMQEIEMPRYYEGHHTGYYTKTAFINNENSTTISYFPNNGSTSLESLSQVTKDANFNVIYEKQTSPDNDINENFYTYSNNHPVLAAKNITTTPIQTITKRNGFPISKSETKYENAASINPTRVLSYKLTSNESDWNNASNAIVSSRFDIYDDTGNLIQQALTPVSENEALFVTTIWGYNKTLPIAKIVGVKYDQLNTEALNNFIATSNSYANSSPSMETTAESTYLNALEAFRLAHKDNNLQMTCYSYYPLIGISQVTPPNGIKEIYEYDNFNRLTRVKNVDGRTLKEINYNLKQ